MYDLGVFMNQNFLLYLILIMAIPGLARVYLNSNFSKYKGMRSSSSMTGFEIAREILDRNGLYDVAIHRSNGNLTDHYDPRSHSVHLSPDIYHGYSVAAKAVAAHEVGHAIQHAQAYGPLKLRSTLVPVVSVANKFGFILIMIGMFTAMFVLAEVGLIMIASLFIFQLITLPVEFNASKRAMASLSEMNLIHNHDERLGVKRVLTAAALTYVAAMLTSLLELIRIAAMISGGRRRR